MTKGKLRALILEYYWMTCYPNADYKEFTNNWLKINDNEPFVEGLIDKIAGAIPLDGQVTKSPDPQGGAAAEEERQIVDDRIKLKFERVPRHGILTALSGL